VAVSVVEAGPAFAAKGGNNDTAKACQHGGWQTPPGVFANQGDCVNDGAQSAQSAPFGTAWSAACGAIPGSVFKQKGESSWSCRYVRGGDQPPTDTNSEALRTACATDTNNQRDLFLTDLRDGDLLAICIA
jgi:hypothetical protein